MPEPLPGSGDEAEGYMRKNRVVHNGGRMTWSGLAALIVALALVGCGRNGGDVPAGFTPVGASGQDNVLVVEVVKEPVDTLNTVPVVEVTVLDRTAADGYRLYRQVGGGGFDQTVDYVTNFVGSTNQGYEAYVATDRDWEPTEPRTYLGRATVNGKESQYSPLTNHAVVPAGDADGLLAGSFLTSCPIDTSKTDSLPLMVWEPVPGATHYVVRIIRTDGHLFFLGLTPDGGATSYQIGSGLGTIFQEQPLTPSTFFWNVMAVDANWRVVGHSDVQIFICDPLHPEPPCTP
jgi:hypothetical protein